MRHFIRRSPAWRAVVTISAVVPAAAGFLGLTTVGTAQAADDPAARVWVTTADGGWKLTPLGAVPFTSDREPIDIEVDPAQREQRFTGAGASVTEASAHLIRGLPEAERDRLMNSLFSTAGDGIGLNYLRQPLGATDFSAGPDRPTGTAVAQAGADPGRQGGDLAFQQALSAHPALRLLGSSATFGPQPELRMAGLSPGTGGGWSHQTYEDTPGEFTIDRDRQEIIPVLQQAFAINPGLRFMGTPWSPPAWMKTSKSVNGGSLEPEHYDDYADYLVRAIQSYGQQGVLITDLTAQNEPQFATSYPSMTMTAAEQAEFFRVLDRALTAANLSTNLLAYDHNWDNPDYPLEVFSGTQGISRVVGAAFHCYAGSPEGQAEVRQAGKRVFFTECSGTDSTTPPKTFADTLEWQAATIVVGNLRNGGETALTWNLALDQHGGPHQGHCGTRCNGVVEISGGEVTRNAEYYVLGHLTKFVRAGAVRIGSTGQEAGGVRNVVFENPDGSRAAYVVNTASSAQRFSITDGGRSLAYRLPPGAVATFVWGG